MKNYRVPLTGGNYATSGRQIVLLTFQPSASESRRSTSVGVEGRTKRFLLNESGTKRKTAGQEVAKPQKELVIEVSTNAKVGSFVTIFFSPQPRVNSSCLPLLPSIFFLSFHLVVMASEKSNPSFQ